MEVQLSQEGLAKLQAESEFLVSLLIFETLDNLKASGKSRIMEKHIVAGMDNILNQASAIDISVNLLNKNIEELQQLRKSTAINKATKFIND